jgi:hypothetical protein
MLCEQTENGWATGSSLEPATKRQACGFTLGMASNLRPHPADSACAALFEMVTLAIRTCWLGQFGHYIN